MRTISKYLIFQFLVFFISCNLPKGSDPSKYLNCMNSRFNKAFFTYCNLHGTDSIIIESYQKGSSFMQPTKKKYYHFAEKYHISASRYHPESWMVILADSLDAEYDYKFVFQDDKAIKTYKLTELTIEPLAEFKRNGEIEYKCELGSWKIEGHEYYGGDFAFN